MEKEAEASSNKKYAPKFTREDAINRIIRDQAIVHRQANEALKEAQENIEKRTVGDIND